MPDIVRFPLPIKFDEGGQQSVDLDEWRDVIRKMDLENIARLAATAMPSLTAMKKVFQEEVIQRMWAASKTQLAVLDGEGVPDGRIVKISTTTKYDKDNEALKAAQEMFHKAGRKDVEVVWDSLESTKVPSIKKVVNSIGPHDSKALRDAAKAMSDAVEEGYKYSQLTIAKGKEANAIEKIQSIKTETVRGGKNEW